MANVAKPVPLSGGPDDAALFESTNNPIKPEASPTPVVEVPPEPKTAAEAKVAEDAEEAAGAPPEAVEQPRQRSPRVPLSDHLTVREELAKTKAERDAFKADSDRRDREYQALQRHVADLNARQQPKTETAAPDFWEDPDKSVQHQVTQAVGPIQQQLLFNARLIAEQVHTPATVKAAADAFDAMSATGQIDPNDQRRIATSPNPFHEAVLWNKRRTALAEVGEDVGAYKQKLRDEAMKDPEFRKAAMAAWRDEAVANANGTGVHGTTLPSLNRATGSGTAVSESGRWKGDQELFDDNNQPRRRA